MQGLLTSKRGLPGTEPQLAFRMLRLHGFLQAGLASQMLPWPPLYRSEEACRGDTIRHRLLPASSLPPASSWLTSSSSPSLLSLAQLSLRSTPCLDINSTITSSHRLTRLVCTQPTTWRSSPTGHKPGHRAPCSKQLARLHSSRAPPPWGQLELELNWCQRVMRELEGEAGFPFTFCAEQGPLLTPS